MPDALAYSRRNLYEQLVVNQNSAYIQVHVMYHQCRLVLHASVVPKFSGVRLHESLPAQVTSVTARTALASAQKISEMAVDLLALEWPGSQIPSFAGYCMYVSASIHITLLHSRDPSLSVMARANLIASLEVLRSVKVYWTNLERLVSCDSLSLALWNGHEADSRQWTRVNVLYEAQLSRYRASLAEPLVGSADNLSQANELDQLASEPRETDQLSEPLADSVLQYTLRRLKRDVHPGRDRAKDGTKALYPDDLDRLMNETSPSASGSQRTSDPATTRFEGNSASNAYVVGASGIPAYGEWTAGTLMAMEQNNGGLDWWDFGLDNGIQGPTGLYEDMFNFNNQIG